MFWAGGFCSSRAASSGRIAGVAMVLGGLQSIVRMSGQPDGVGAVAPCRGAVPAGAVREKLHQGDVRRFEPVRR